MSTSNTRWLRHLDLPVAVVIALLIVLVLNTEPAGGKRSNHNETPRQFNASLFQPCAFELGNVTAPDPQGRAIFALKDLADSQHYNYVEYTNTTGARPAGTLAATLDTFATLNAVNRAGIIEIETHGSTEALLMECYPADATGRAARNQRLQRICNGMDRPAGIQLSCPKDVYAANGQKMVQEPNLEIHSVSSDNGIAVTRDGIRKLLPQLAHNIVFVGACNSFSDQPKTVKDGFMTTPIEYLGYADKCHSGPVSRDTTTFFRRLAGLEFDGKAREVGRHGIIFTPDGECTELAHIKIP